MVRRFVRGITRRKVMPDTNHTANVPPVTAQSARTKVADREPRRAGRAPSERRAGGMCRAPERKGSFQRRLPVGGRGRLPR